MAVVTSDGSGCSETAGDCGVLVPPHDVPALAAAFRDLLASPERIAELGHRARQRVEAHFDRRALAQRYLAVLTEVAQENQQRSRT
jgi:glycosyltransferase involved in cell wall biosynthesis